MINGGGVGLRFPSPVYTKKLEIHKFILAAINPLYNNSSFLNDDVPTMKRIKLVLSHRTAALRLPSYKLSLLRQLIVYIHFLES